MTGRLTKSQNQPDLLESGFTKNYKAPGHLSYHCAVKGR